MSVVASDKAQFFQPKSTDMSLYFSINTYVVGTHKKRLTGALLMSTHNICFCGELRKIFCGYSYLELWSVTHSITSF